ncbi:MAG TPA: NAD-dependent deacylase [Burkholderiales bacterium]|nr:NAD-dependent deacylase [Burkholderiales bacterium]
MLNDVVQSLQAARALVVVTGAGVSAESGIPTFRDAMTGLWARYNPEDLATPAAFARNPERVSRWYDERRVRCASCAPNPGHYALAELERRFLEAGRDFVLLTQNVDRLHQRAGSKRVVELHGTLWVWRCTDCGAEREESPAPFATYPPRCECGGLRRPGVVWFGETLPTDALAQAHPALEACDVFLSVGTSAMVEPAASFVHLAKGVGTRTIEINLDSTPISDFVDYSLRGKTGEILPQVVQRLGLLTTN